jgi:GGDEF domain-containing protein
VSEKRQHTVAVIAGKNHPISYVRLDCDGFGSLKESLGGDEKPSEVLRKAARFFKEKLSSSCLVFHPHGDEFVLLFINLRPRHVIKQLADFQKAFVVEDFRPSGHDTPLTFGIRMVVSFWLDDRILKDAERAYDILRTEAETIDIKHRDDRGFIEIAQSNTPTVGSISSQAIQESVLWARGYSRFFVANTSKSGEELKKSKELLGWESGVPTGFLWWSEAAVGRTASRRTALRCRSASPGGGFWLAAQTGF